MLTICFVSFTSLPLKTLSQEFLLFSQILLDKAVLTHFLSNLSTQRAFAIEFKVQVHKDCGDANFVMQLHAKRRRSNK